MKNTTQTKRFQNYIVVREDGKIETPSFPHNITHDFIKSVGQLGGHHLLSTKPGSQAADVVIFWSDEGSMNGMKRNAPVSNLLGFTTYGPCLFAQNTTNSAGLKPEQFDLLMWGLRNGHDPEPKELEEIVRRQLNMLGSVSRAECAELDLATFRSNIDTSGHLYGFIRQIPDAGKRREFVKRLNSVRNEMRASCQMRTDIQLIIGWADEEVE